MSDPVERDGDARVLVALVAGTRLRVTTATRDFEGHIFEVGRSPYHGDLTARLVDDEGRVHYFRPSRDDCTVNEAK